MAWKRLLAFEQQITAMLEVLKALASTFSCPFVTNSVQLSLCICKNLSILAELCSGPCPSIPCGKFSTSPF